MQLFICTAYDTFQGHPLAVLEPRERTKNDQEETAACYASIFIYRYGSQGQTISHSIIDIAIPPSGRLTPFSMYVALSRAVVVTLFDCYEILMKS